MKIRVSFSIRGNKADAERFGRFLEIAGGEIRGLLDSGQREGESS